MEFWGHYGNKFLILVYISCDWLEFYCIAANDSPCQMLCNTHLTRPNQIKSNQIDFSSHTSRFKAGAQGTKMVGFDIRTLFHSQHSN